MFERCFGSEVNASDVEASGALACIDSDMALTLSRLHFPRRYKLSVSRFCACAKNVKSSMCSETQIICGYSLALLW